MKPWSPLSAVALTLLMTACVTERDAREPVAFSVPVSSRLLNADQIRLLIEGNTITLKQPGTWFHIYFDPHRYWIAKYCRADACPRGTNKWWIEDNGSLTGMLCRRLKTNKFASEVKTYCYQVLRTAIDKVTFRLAKEGESRDIEYLWEAGNRLSFYNPDT